jgi:hypothetical protein
MLVGVGSQCEQFGAAFALGDGIRCLGGAFLTRSAPATVGGEQLFRESADGREKVESWALVLRLGDRCCVHVSLQ